MAEQGKSYERVLIYLEEELREGNLALGQSLPPERELAEQLGISRNSVREAIRLLEQMGFIISSQGAGNFVSCDIGRNLKGTFELLILLQRIDYRQLAELRAGLELQAALLAADRITDQEAEDLFALAAEMDHSPVEQGARLDKQFHDAIAACSGNELIIQILRALSVTIDRFISDMRQRILRDPGRADQLQYAHEQMADALRRRDKIQLALAVDHHFSIVNANMGED
ncbi:MAG: FCD domain-containing protein [Clostridiales bacterium]|nr:FCD domain-containing protein [Clostridiales bacterium]